MSDRDVSTVVLRVCLFRIIPFIVFSKYSCDFGVIEKLTRACYFQIALETMLLPILSRRCLYFNLG